DLVTKPTEGRSSKTKALVHCRELALGGRKVQVRLAYKTDLCGTLAVNLRYLEISGLGDLQQGEEINGVRTDWETNQLSNVLHIPLHGIGAPRLDSNDVLTDHDVLDIAIGEVLYRNSVLE